MTAATHRSFKVNVPTSKSLSNRWLVLNYLSNDSLNLHDLSSADDTMLLQTLLKDLNKDCENTFYCKNAGTVARFLTAVLCIQEGKEYIITGDERMQQRPIDPLVEALRQIGADISYLNTEGHFPLKIKGKTLIGNTLSISADISSQFVSALMLIAPFLPQGLTIEIQGAIASRPYILMTQKVLQQAGIKVRWSDNKIHIHNSTIKPQSITIEKDWSSVSYLYNWILFLPQKEYELHVEGLFKDSCQGDKVVAELYETLGVTTFYTSTGITLKNTERRTNTFVYNFKDCPDLVPTLAVACAGLGISGTLLGLDTLPYKETNRIEALAAELNKMNINVSYNSKSLHIEAGKLKITQSISTYNDHRMAMAFAALQAFDNNITIKNHEVVNKSFPEYWQEISNLK